MSTIQALNDTIAEYQDQLNYSRHIYRGVSASLSSNPSDTDLLNKARVAKAKVTELEEHLAILEESRAASQTVDAIEAEKAIKALAIKHLDNVKRIADARAKTSQKIDKALDDLAKHCAEFGEQSLEESRAIRGFYQIVARGKSQSQQEAVSQIAFDTERVPGNNVMAKFSEAVAPLNIKNYMVLNFQTPYGTALPVAPDVIKSDKRIITNMEAAAEYGGFRV